MSTSHHLAAETLLDYASGSLSLPMETLVACHLTVCARCREQAGLAEALGAAELAQAESRPMRGGADALLARASRARASRTGAIWALADREPAGRVRSAEGDRVPAGPGGAEVGGSGPDGDASAANPPGRVPRPLGRLLPGPLDALPWRRLAPGIKQYNLSDEPRRNGAFKLLHLAPGVVLSGHTHNERELTYLVQGSYQDEIGRFRAGDIADLDGNVVHQPVVDTDEPCIALIATDSPVRYTGVFGRLVQPFVGI